MKNEAIVDKPIASLGFIEDRRGAPRNLARLLAELPDKFQSNTAIGILRILTSAKLDGHARLHPSAENGEDSHCAFCPVGQMMSTQ